jgi:hypothetical protein
MQCEDIVSFFDAGASKLNKSLDTEGKEREQDEVDSLEDGF